MKQTTFNRAKDHSLFWFLLAGLVMLLIGLTAHAQTTQATTRPMMRGVWYQPVDSFAKWKARGVDTLIGYEGNSGQATAQQYLDAAHAAGLRVWVQRTAMTPALYKHPALAGVVNSPDEPDGVGNATPDQVKASYDQVKADMAAAGVSLPVMVNFDGNKMPWRPAADYAAYCQGADVVAFDCYPLNWGWGPSQIPTITTKAQKLVTLSGGKPVICCIESGPQDLGKQPWTLANDASGTPLSPKMRGPTADEFRAEVQDAIAGGVSGLVYFPDMIGAGWEGFDGTPDDIVTAMTQINATLVVSATGGVAANSGNSAVPATTQATTAPATKPSVPVAQAQLKQWLLLARDYKHHRIVLTWVDARGKTQTTLITDPDTIAAIDAAAGK